MTWEKENHMSLRDRFGTVFDKFEGSYATEHPDFSQWPVNPPQELMTEIQHLIDADEIQEASKPAKARWVQFRERQMGR